MLILSLLWKIALSERKSEREKKWFFAKLSVEFGSRSTKMCLRWHFLPPQKGKNTGVKGRLEGRKWLFSGIILTYLQDKQHINKRRKRRNPQLKGVPKNTKRNILRCKNNVYPLNYHTLSLNKSFSKNIIENQYRVILGQSHFGSFWKFNVIFSHSII